MTGGQFIGASMVAIAGVIVLAMSVQMMGFRGAATAWFMAGCLAALTCGGVYLLVGQ